jgi:hypothetical protein
MKFSTSIFMAIFAGAIYAAPAPEKTSEEVSFQIISDDLGCVTVANDKLTFTHESVLTCIKNVLHINSEGILTINEKRVGVKMLSGLLVVNDDARARFEIDGNKLYHRRQLLGREAVVAKKGGLTTDDADANTGYTIVPSSKIFETIGGAQV